MMEGHNDRIIEQDTLNWTMGQYVLSALNVAMDATFSKHPSAKYVEGPRIGKMLEDARLTDEERERLALEEEIRKMEMWVANDRMNGLPETKTK